MLNNSFLNCEKERRKGGGEFKEFKEHVKIHVLKN